MLCSNWCRPLYGAQRGTEYWIAECCAAVDFVRSTARNAGLSTEERNAVQHLMSSALRRAKRDWILKSGMLCRNWCRPLYGAQCGTEYWRAECCAAVAFVRSTARNAGLSTEDRNAVQHLMSSALRRATRDWVLHSRWLHCSLCSIAAMGGFRLNNTPRTVYPSVRPSASQ